MGIGVIISSSSIARNPFVGKHFLLYAIIGFALTEVIVFFGLMMAFLLIIWIYIANITTKI
jgi:F0F1-type ATP synthase membrane subunit c/vacuolar-type H+-ATPase subunit K